MRSRRVRYAYGFGSSQSGRFLRSFLYEGFNTDERDRQVFDGVIAHIAGASRINLNERWSTPTGPRRLQRHGVSVRRREPARSGERRAARGCSTTRGRARIAPKVFYTNTPVEYWGTGRVAALVHTTPDGTADLPLPDNVRFYFIAGTQHSPEPIPASGHQRPAGGQPGRLLVDDARAAAGDAQVGEGRRGAAAEPVSALQDGTLVPASAVAFPAIPGVASPRALTAGRASRTGSCRAAPAPARRCRCSCPRSTRTATSAPASGCPTSPCRSRPTPAGISASRDRRAGRARLAARFVDPVPGDARGARGGEGSAPLDRGAVPRRATSTSRKWRRSPTRSCSRAILLYDEPRIRAHRCSGRRDRLGPTMAVSR